MAMTRQEIKEFYDWNGLVPCLTKFDEHDWKGSFSKNNWKVANGGYDLWFQLYYDNVPVLDCVSGVVSSCYGLPQEIVNIIIGKVIKKFPHLKIEPLYKEGNLVELPDGRFGKILRVDNYKEYYIEVLDDEDCVVDQEAFPILEIEKCNIDNIVS